MSGGRKIRWKTTEESGPRTKTALVRMERKEQCESYGV